jgi:1-acyl-sn-glycerol-3-phosphate acyltransferase
MLILRSALFNLVFYATLIVMMILGAPTLLVGRPAIMRISGLWAKISLGLLRMICGTRIEVRGREHLPQQGYILAAKHQSFLDICAMIAALPEFTFILKRELMWLPLFGWYLSRSEQIAIDRGRGRAALAKVTSAAAAALARGRPVFIFPEGTRRPPGAEPKYKYGVALIYATAGVPCVPMALNTGLFWPRRSFIRRPGTAVLEILPLIPSGLDRATFFDLMQSRIEDASNRLIEEALTGRHAP